MAPRPSGHDSARDDQPAQSRPRPAPTLLSSTRTFHSRLSSLSWPRLLVVLPLFAVLLFHLLSLVSCDEPAPPPIQHHVYYSGSHVTSIAVDVSGDVYATEVVWGRVIHYNSSGNVQAVWRLTGPASWYSPTSVATMSSSYDASTLVYVTDSTTGRVLWMNGSTGEPIVSSLFALPPDMWECGLISAPGEYQYHIYVTDRYHGRTVRVNLDNTSQYVWESDAAPPPPDSSLTAAYIAAAAVRDTGTAEPGVVFLLDGSGDRVLRLAEGNGTYMGPLLFQLPANVTGMLALSWTWCGDESYGCLWVLYQPRIPRGAARSVMAVSVLNGAVVYSWTMSAAAGERTAASADRGEQHRQQQRQQQQRVSPSWPATHVVSPAMHVISMVAVRNDAFHVYTAEADPTGPGHVIVVRDETGMRLQQFDSIPPQYDITYQAMHAFSAVLAERVNCTLWLTDVDNGGLLVRAAADGSILEWFKTPALFSSVLLDTSNGADNSSLVLLFSNATDWQLWRFYPASGQFVQLNTTAVRQRYNSTNYRSSSGSSAGLVDDGSMAVGGLDVNYDGRLVLSLPHANVIVLLDADGEWYGSSNETGSVLVRPSLVLWTLPHAAVVVDRSGELGEWILQMWDGNQLRLRTSIEPPLLQPLALTYDILRRSLWMSLSNGFVYQLSPISLLSSRAAHISLCQLRTSRRYQSMVLGRCMVLTVRLDG